MKMKTRRMKLAAWIAALGALAAFPMGCPTWRTEHKIETVSRIEAHIVIDIRKEAAATESEVRKDEAKDPGKPQSSLAREMNGRMVASGSLSRLFDLAPTAAAAAVDEKGAIARRRDRLKAVEKALADGCVGENNKGMLEARPCEPAKDDEAKGKIKALIKDENADRKIIYEAIALRQGLKAEQYDVVGRVYAGELRKPLKPGMAFQAPEADDLYEEFLKSELGKQLKETPKKGAWVSVPK